jgi:TatD DNase family protein
MVKSLSFSTKKKNVIDAHIHLDDERFDSNRGELIAQAQEAGITKFIVPAVIYSGFEKLKRLSEQFNCIIPSYGLHPYFIKQHAKQGFDTLDNYLVNNPSCAVGECGLDFFLKDLDKDTQHNYFEAQIALAKKHQKPLILHARGAVDAVFNHLKKADYFNAMIHSYNGSLQQTKQLLDKGIKFSFGGAITHPKAHKLHKLVQYIPTDAIMFETDAPDQNLYPDYKAINLPINLVKIIKFYAKNTHQAVEKVANISTQVTMDFFRLDK